MIAQLVTYNKEKIENIRVVEISDDYDGDPYGDKVPFPVGSNQMIIYDENLFVKLWHSSNGKLFLAPEGETDREEYKKELKDIYGDLRGVKVFYSSQNRKNIGLS